MSPSHTNLEQMRIARADNLKQIFYGGEGDALPRDGVRGLGAGRANEGTLPRIRQRWTAAETNSAGSVQGSVQVFELATWHGRGA